MPTMGEVRPDDQCILCRYPPDSEMMVIIHDRYHDLPEPRQWFLTWAMRDFEMKLIEVRRRRADRDPAYKNIKIMMGSQGRLELFFKMGRFENRLA